jgi:hypothetical protein
VHVSIFVWEGKGREGKWMDETMSILPYPHMDDVKTILPALDGFWRKKCSAR